MLPKNTLFGKFGQDIGSVVWTLELAKEIHTTIQTFSKTRIFLSSGNPKMDISSENSNRFCTTTILSPHYSIHHVRR